MKHGIFERFGAFGVVAALTLGGGGLFMRRCAPAPAPVQIVSAPLPINASLVHLVNDQRAAVGINALSEDGALDAAAVAHSQDQARRKLMTHIGSNGSGAGSRITAHGFQWSTWGENVAAGQPDADSVLSAWMNSPSHRANILSANFTSIGVAAVTASNGVIYWTMDLATRR